eukprot:NODE_514_length_7360_cov_0.614378.p3 type:complete len:287 gc:universal NODE_514_length_7360_cov_0.614378:5864-5004(-)
MIVIASLLFSLLLSKPKIFAASSQIEFGKSIEKQCSNLDQIELLKEKIAYTEQSAALHQHEIKNSTFNLKESIVKTKSHVDHLKRDVEILLWNEVFHFIITIWPTAYKFDENNKRNFDILVASIYSQNRLESIIFMRSMEDPSISNIYEFNVGVYLVYKRCWQDRLFMNNDCNSFILSKYQPADWIYLLVFIDIRNSKQLANALGSIITLETLSETKGQFPFDIRHNLQFIQNLSGISGTESDNASSSTQIMHLHGSWLMKFILVPFTLVILSVWLVKTYRARWWK